MVEMFCIDCVKVNTLVVVSYCGTTRHYNWGKLNEEYMESLCIAPYD